MKLYNKENFLKLPENTIYNLMYPEAGDLLSGFYCKTSDNSWGNDWVYQDLLGECGDQFPEEDLDGFDSIQRILDKRDNFEHFETDLDCSGRDGRFEDNDMFIVWDKHDINKLINYLKKCIK